ncbi:MAG: hypothetical protein HY437_02045 [Candidatus Magasanikbacteria bacterium]|nr:hypothetical protein [Candidatus Magasanikbacteria bacterium]
MPKEVIIVWIANGFNPADPSHTDPLSQEALSWAARNYRRYVREGTRVFFLIIKSIVRSADNDILHDVMYKEALGALVAPADIILSRETTGSPTDGLAIAMVSRDHPDAELELYACLKEAADYFRVMYRAVAEHILGYTMPLLGMRTLNTKVGLKSRLLYRAMRAVTHVARMTKPTFRIWYNFLNWAYRRRVTHGFGRTIA